MALESRGRGTGAGVPERQLVLFGVGSVVYGLPIDRVREVVNPQAVIELPHAPPSVVGVTDHRGEVVPVLDLRTRFGLGPLTDSETKRRVKWIMVDVGRVTDDAIGRETRGRTRLVAAVVDVVHNVYMTRDALRPAPPLGGGEDTRGILGVLSRGQGEQGLIFVLDLDRLRALTEGVAT